MLLYYGRIIIEHQNLICTSAEHHDLICSKRINETLIFDYRKCSERAFITGYHYLQTGYDRKYPQTKKIMCRKLGNNPTCSGVEIVYFLIQTWLLNAESLSFFPKVSNSFITISFRSERASCPRARWTLLFFLARVCSSDDVDETLKTKETP